MAPHAAGGTAAVAQVAHAAMACAAPGSMLAWDDEHWWGQQLVQGLAGGLREASWRLVCGLDMLLEGLHAEQR